MAVANSTMGSGYLTSSILTGADAQGYYTLLTDNETIEFKKSGGTDLLRVTAITIYAGSTALKIVPNGDENYGYIYIPANGAKTITPLSMTSMKVKNLTGVKIYYEAIYV